MYRRHLVALGAGMSEERFDRIDERLDRLEVRQEDLKSDVARRFDAIGERFDELGRQMRVLHEGVLARIAAIPEYSGPTRDDRDRCPGTEGAAQRTSAAGA